MLLLLMSLLAVGAALGLLYLARAFAYAYIYVTTAMGSRRAGKVVRRFFPKMALEVDKTREVTAPETLRQTDQLFREGLWTTLRKMGLVFAYVLLGALVVLALLWLLR